jgi:hypothetical protein
MGTSMILGVFDHQHERREERRNRKGTSLYLSGVSLTSPLDARYISSVVKGGAPRLAQPFNTSWEKESPLRSKMREFRFAVGSPAGPRSTVWKAFTNRGDIYLQSRMMGANAKLSFHASGIAQWSFQEDWFRKNRPDRPLAERHINTWKWTLPSGSTTTHLYRVYIPESELRPIKVSEKLDKVRWVPAPEVGHMISVDCYVSPGDPTVAPVHLSNFFFVLGLDGERSLVALMNNFAVPDSAQMELERVRADARQYAAENGILLKPQFRAGAFSIDTTGVPGVIEFVPGG